MCVCVCVCVCVKRWRDRTAVQGGWMGEGVGLGCFVLMDGEIVRAEEKEVGGCCMRF